MSVKRFKEKIRERIYSPSGRNFFTFLIFLTISAVFWLVTAMNDEIQHDLDVHVRITDIPHGVTMMSNNEGLYNVAVSVKDKGINMIVKKLLNKNTVNIPFRDFVDDGHRLFLSELQLTTILRQYFGNYSTVLSHDPDSLSLPYTTIPPTRLPVKINASVQTRPQYIVNGALKSSLDSVFVYTTGLISDSIKAIHTEQIILTEINDTTRVMVALAPPPGCRVVPDNVTITIPVEPLITKTIEIPVEVLNLPEDQNIIVFPNTVDFTCLVPMSMFNDNSFPVKAYADYHNRKDNTIPLETSLIPEIFINPNLQPDVAEYIVVDK